MPASLRALGVHGFQLLRTEGKLDHRRDDPTLLHIEKTTVLVTAGAYKYVRHPLYCAFLLLTWGSYFFYSLLAGRFAGRRGDTERHRGGLGGGKREPAVFRYCLQRLYETNEEVHSFREYATALIRAERDAADHAGALFLFQRPAVHNLVGGRRCRRRADGNKLLAGQTEHNTVQIMDDRMVVRAWNGCRCFNSREAEQQ